MEDNNSLKNELLLRLLGTTKYTGWRDICGTMSDFEKELIEKMREINVSCSGSVVRDFLTAMKQKNVLKYHSIRVHINSHQERPHYTIDLDLLDAILINNTLFKKDILYYRDRFSLVVSDTLPY